MNNNECAITELLHSIEFLIEQKLLKTTKCYDGLISGFDGSDKAIIKLNGKEYHIKKYRNNDAKVGSMVKVIIPQGNMNLAFYF